jgi:hypothetical protein
MNWSSELRKSTKGACIGERMKAYEEGFEGLSKGSSIRSRDGLEGFSFCPRDKNSPVSACDELVSPRIDNLPPRCMDPVFPTPRKRSGNMTSNERRQESTCVK